MEEEDPQLNLKNDIPWSDGDRKTFEDHSASNQYPPRQSLKQKPESTDNQLSLFRKVRILPKRPFKCRYYRQQEQHGDIVYVAAAWSLEGHGVDYVSAKHVQILSRMLSPTSPELKLGLGRTLIFNTHSRSRRSPH